MLFQRTLIALAASMALLSTGAYASNNGLVISQVYGGGGNSGSIYKNDFIELFNSSTVAINLSGYSVQYAGATGTTWQTTPLTGTLAPGRYYLIQQAIGVGGTTALPTPDATGTIAMSASAGKIALVSSTTALSGATPTSASIVDLIGFGTANFYEGSAPASALSNTLADFRAANGCTDTNSNSVDFTAAAAGPRNSASTAVVCSGTAPAPAPTPTPTPTPSSVRIHDIQGAAHRSPLEGTAVSSVPGIVTALGSTGFYMEDPLPDTNPATSEGIFIYTATAPSVAVGQYVLVSGTVNEFRPGSTSGVNNLTTTQISSPTVVSGGTAPAALPAPVVIGLGGRMPPTSRLAGAASGGSVEVAGYVFDAVNNGVDFYESLEGMRVVVNNAVVVGPTSAFNEIVVVGDGGSFAGLRSARGGLVINATDYNPERVFLDDLLIAANTMPKANVGDTLSAVQGVMDYSFGNFKVQVTAAPVRQAGPLAQEVTALQGDALRLTVASFNVENLAATNAASKFAALGTAVVTNLKSPDIIGLMEIQDNNGATTGSVVDASTTITTLINAISAAGGPTYSYRQINPVADQDGGEPGGNIRQVFLFNPARVLFVDRPVANPSTTAVTAVAMSPGVRLSASPGRIAPTNSAFNSSRKPLVGEFSFGGRTLFVIANHFNSKGGDYPLSGRFQPPVLSSEIQRNLQADLVAGFVSQLTAADAQARVVVLGDLNDFEFSSPVNKLKAIGLADLVETLPANERYTYVYEGNSQALDHIMVSNNMKGVAEYDIVHINSEFATQISDHEPEVARLKIGRADYSAQIVANSSAYVLNRATGQYTGSVTLTNKGTAISGPLLVSLSGLNASVTLANSQGQYAGMPTISLSGGITANGSVNVPLSFTNPNKVAISYTVRVVDGPF